MNVWCRQVLSAIFILILFSCNKEYSANPNPVPPSEPVKKILLKDITIPSLPSPYYHFEYNADSTVSKVDYSSGYTIYDIVYNGSRIGEMRNNILVNHDTLRYFYNNEGKLATIKFINDANLIYRFVNISYNGTQVNKIEWNQKEGNGDFITDRTLNFTYYPDGNVKTIIEHRPPMSGSPEYNVTRAFDQYDDKINVDDFSIIHDGIHDHLFLLQGFRLQRNNPRRETFTGGIVTLSYAVDYTYTYNADGTPLTKSGDLVFTKGIDSGRRFQTSSFYSYY